MGLRVRLFEWTPEKELRLECSHFNNVIALYVKTKGDFILMGDIERAISILQYRTMEGSFKKISRDYKLHWMTAVEILYDDIVLEVAKSVNLFVCQLDSPVTSDEKRQLMQEVALFHLGDLYNVLRHGSLVMQNSGESTTSTTGSILFGTVSGSVGVITQIRPELYDLLTKLQDKLSPVIKSMGQIDHSFLRAFYTEVRREICEGFVNGDLVESVLDLPQKK